MRKLETITATSSPRPRLQLLRNNLAKEHQRCSTPECEGYAVCGEQCYRCFEDSYEAEQLAKQMRMRADADWRAYRRQSQGPASRLNALAIFVVIACALGWVAFETFPFWVELFTGQHLTAVWRHK